MEDTVTINRPGQRKGERPASRLPPRFSEEDLIAAALAEAPIVKGPMVVEPLKVIAACEAGGVVVKSEGAEERCGQSPSRPSTSFRQGYGRSSPRRRLASSLNPPGQVGHAAGARLASPCSSVSCPPLGQRTYEGRGGHPRGLRPAVGSRSPVRTPPGRTAGCFIRNSLIWWRFNGDGAVVGRGTVLLTASNVQKGSGTAHRDPAGAGLRARRGNGSLRAGRRRAPART